MSSFPFNRAKGRGAEWGERINASEPTNAVLVVGLVLAAGVEADAVLEDKDSLTDLFSGTTAEASDGSYARKVLDDGDGITVTYNDTDDRVEVFVPDQTFAALDGGDISDLFTGYDPDSTGGDDTAILPFTFHDFEVSPDGSDVTVDVPATGFYQAA